MKLSNNKVAFLAILLMLISLTCNAIIYQKTSIGITGKATARGYVIICLNHPPVLNEFSSNLGVKEGGSFFYDVNITDLDDATQSFTFYDNASLFNISPETGIINFTAPGNSAGVYDILITVQDNSSCANSNNTEILVLNITMDNVAPSITSYYPLTDPTISEIETQLFNITYEDADNDALTVYWYLNNDLVSLFDDAYSILKSNYTFVGNYTNAEIYNVTVVVSDSRLNDSHSWTLTVTNVNRAPSFIRTIKNQTWAEDSGLYGIDLDDYSYDPDTDDTLSYSVNYWTNPHNIVSSINENNVVTFSQPKDWYGTENISFTVTDNHELSNTSNNITLTVYDVPETNITTGITAFESPGRTAECIEYWFCTYWSVCYLEGFMERKCTDLSDCGTEYYKPSEREGCKYIPSCFNKVKDGDETGIDCGGKCGLCPSCFDGIMNNDETGIDCGGSCPPCPTCFDSIINGGEIGVDCGGACSLQDCCANGYRDAHIGEEGIDCGGACKKCEVKIEKPAPQILWWIIAPIIFLVVILLLIMLYLNRRRIKMFFLLAIDKLRKKKITASIKMRDGILSDMNKLERRIELESSEAGLKQFLVILKEILMKMFKIKHEFDYQEVIPLIKNSRIKPVVKLILINYIKRVIDIAYSGYSISKGELVLLTKELRIILYLISRAIKKEEWKGGKCVKEKESYESELERFYVTLSKLLFMLENLEIEKAKKTYMELKEAYTKLSPEEKEESDNYLERIKEETKLFEEKSEIKKRTRKIGVAAIALMAILFLSNMGVFFGGNISGLFVFEGENGSGQQNSQFLANIKGFNIEVGEHFVYRIKGYDNEDSTLLFSDDTKLFNISSNGIIDFTPAEDKVGVHHITIIAMDNNYKISVKGVILNITKEKIGEKVIEAVTEINETEEVNGVVEEINISGELNKTEGIVEELNITQEINESEEVNEVVEEINISGELNKTVEGGNVTKELDETLNVSSDVKQGANESENIVEQVSEDFLLKPLDMYAREFELGSTVEFNLLVENNGTKEIENAYFRAGVEENGSRIIEIQSTPIAIGGEEKREMVAYWNTENIAVGEYFGKLAIMYEDKISENDIRMDVSANDVQTEIIGVTGMVTAPSSAIEIELPNNLNHSLMVIAIILVIMYIILLTCYLKGKHTK